MTKKELKQIFYLNNELLMWQEELDKLQYKSLVAGQAMNGMPKSKSISDVVGEIASDIADVKNVIKGKLAEIQLQRNRVIHFINGIDDSLIRQVVFYRCVSCQSWSDVADSIGGEHSGDSLRVMFDRYLIREADDAEDKTRTNNRTRNA